MARCIALLLLLLVAAAAAEPLDFLGGPCFGETCDNGMECLELSGDKCAWEGFLLEDSTCTCGGVGGEGDPYFSGFHGQSFYFAAEADTTYSLFSSEDHIINAHFVATDLPAESDLVGFITGANHSSFIGTLAVQHKNATAEVFMHRDGQVTVTLNGKQVDFKLTYEKPDFEGDFDLGSNVIVRVESYPGAQGTLVAIETPILFIGAYPNLPHKDNMGNLVRGHLNLHLSMKRAREQCPPAHGVLGQTLHSDTGVNMDEPDMFPGKGAPSDYAVSSLFATDDSFSMFGNAPLPVQQRPAELSLSRRLLVSRRQQQQAAEKLQAGFGSHSWTANFKSSA